MSLGLQKPALGRVLSIFREAHADLSRGVRVEHQQTAQRFSEYVVKQTGIHNQVQNSAADGEN